MALLFPARLSIAALVLTTILTVLTGCNNVSPTEQKIATSHIKSAVIPSTAMQPAIQQVVGDYASEGYDKRVEGYDWVGVQIRPFGAAEINIKVRARRDIKKPTCSFDGTATLMGQDDAHGIIFQTMANDSVTFLQFKDGMLTIDAQDKYALNTFCSGGATLAGDYQKLKGNLELN